MPAVSPRVHIGFLSDMVQTSAEYINYPVDTEALGNLIDTLCDMTKVVNYEEIPTLEPVKEDTENEQQ